MKRTLEACLYNWDKTPSLSYLYPLNYLKRTSHIECFYNGPIREYVLIHAQLRLRSFDKKEFDLQADDKTFAVNE